MRRKLRYYITIKIILVFLWGILINIWDIVTNIWVIMVKLQRTKV